MVDRIAWWLVLIGAMNWLLVGLFQFDLVGYLFGDGSVGSDAIISRVVYILVGLAGVYLLPQAFGVKMVGRK